MSTCKILLLSVAVLFLCACDLLESIDPEYVLFKAAYEGRERNVERILDTGKVKNIDALFSSCTALHFAVAHGNIRIVRMLISHGANIHSVCANTDPNDNSHTPLDWAARFGRLEIDQELVKSGAGMNRESSFCFTPLITALRKRHTNIAKFFVESCADACTKRVNNRNALQAEKAYKQPEFVYWHEKINSRSASIEYIIHAI